MANMAYRGTVCGAPHSNLHFADVHLRLRSLGYAETCYADDLNAFKAFRHNVPNDAVLYSLEECKLEAHPCGRASRVTFDPNKEHVHNLSRLRPHGGNLVSFRVDFDKK